ncbi:MAG: AI-2E family transporter, partial [Pseudomonadota bacterium]|nr:AI-2E family transporter [Pseudomonadota bacterium]
MTRTGEQITKTPARAVTPTRSRRTANARVALATVATAALACVVWPYLGAVFWSIVFAIVLAPVHRRMLRVTAGRKTLAGLATLAAFVMGVGVPLALLGAVLLRQASGLYRDVAAGKIDFVVYGQRIADALPAWLRGALEGSGIDDWTAIREKLSASALETSKFIAAHLFGIGLNVFSFALSLALMLYLLYVLLNEGESLASRIERFIPLTTEEVRSLASTFTTVIRATVKGGIVMAATQGTLGGFMLGFLGIEGPLFWGVVFGLLSMVPAVGAGLLWAPIALYFLVTGAVWK